MLNFTGLYMFKRRTLVKVLYSLYANPIHAIVVMYAFWKRNFHDRKISTILGVNFATGKFFTVLNAYTLEAYAFRTDCNQNALVYALSASDFIYILEKNIFNAANFVML